MVCWGSWARSAVAWILLGGETLITARCWLLSKGKFLGGNTQSVRITHAQFEKKISRRCRRLFPVLIPFSTSLKPQFIRFGFKFCLGIMGKKPSYHPFRNCTNGYALSLLSFMYTKKGNMVLSRKFF